MLEGRFGETMLRELFPLLTALCVAVVVYVVREQVGFSPMGCLRVQAPYR